MGFDSSAIRHILTALRQHETPSASVHPYVQPKASSENTFRWRNIVTKPSQTEQPRQASDDKSEACCFMEKPMSSAAPPPQQVQVSSAIAFEQLLAQAWQLRENQKMEQLKASLSSR